jgi:tRNA modification GTPase
MYELNETIAAVSSPTSDKRVIVRLSGPNTTDILGQIFSPKIPQGQRGLIRGSVAIDDGLRMDAKLYLFLAPDSYTGDDVAEIHIHTNASVTEALLGRLLGDSGVPVRMAGPGEFTARSFLNGKIDLSQAEAVNEIIVSSNKFQLAAAEKLLAGRLAETAAEVRERLMDCLSLIEAGLDFSGEDIEFITCSEAIRRLVEITEQLEQLLSDNISYESVIDLPAVGIAGVPNSGKSSLLNKLLGKSRSIVSSRRKTTRDVLTGLLTLIHCRCVLFDCAGLMQEAHIILDELAQQAAIEALRNASVVVFCIDISSQKSEIRTQKFLLSSVLCFLGPAVIPVATKSDLLGERALAKRLVEMNELFAAEFLPVSAETGAGVELLRDTIDGKIIELAFRSSPSIEHRASAIRRPAERIENRVALTARHRQAVTEAIENISESVSELKAGNDEVSAMMLRAACQGLSNIEHQHIDEQILERIFKHFCIGK